jgi:GDP-mannose 6-dehydrogenase
MKVAIFGLGYVGTVCGACLASVGHEIVGVEPNDTKVNLVNAGQAPLVEPGLDALLADAVKSGKLRATREARDAVAWANVSLVCVGTPQDETGALNLDYIRNVCREIGTAISARNGYHVITIRSTTPPGTLDECRRIVEQESGKAAGQGFGLACNPEFLREGSAIRDFRNPPYTLIGADDERAAAMLRELYSGIDAPVHVAPVKVAEMMKFVNNSYHALKVTFANEVGTVCKALGVDSHEVMNLFGRDTRLNISTTYFKPGFAFGGSCLPKDLSALNHMARQANLSVPVLASIAASNRNHIQNGLRLIQATGKRRIGLLGLSFKAGTDDLRESPLVDVVETLLGKGYAVSIYDRNVNVSRLMGANKAYIEQQIPHIAQLFVADIEDILREAECIVIGNGDPEFADALNRVRQDQVVVDLVRATPHALNRGNYEGICW